MWSISCVSVLNIFHEKILNFFQIRVFRSCFRRFISFFIEFVFFGDVFISSFC